MTAREDVLARIAAAHQAAPPPDLAYRDIDRSYRDQPGRPAEELLALLVDRLVDYRARVRSTSAADLPGVVATALADQGVRSVARPPELPEEWLREAAAMARTDRPDEPLSIDELDGVDGVITGCAVASAETGTLVLDGSADQGRRVLTLVPDYHLCVVRASQVVADVPQALARLDPVRPLTFISGPSATSDIELSRVEGVHGPRTLEVVLVTDR